MGDAWFVDENNILRRLLVCLFVSQNLLENGICKYSHVNMPIVSFCFKTFL